MRLRAFLVLLVAVFLSVTLVPGEAFCVKKATAAGKKTGKKGKKGGKKKGEAAGGKDTDSENDEEEMQEEPEDDVPMAAAGAKGGSAGEGGMLQRSGRMEFDERLVKGQAAQSGAVYLFKRVPRQLPGLVPLRRSYRKRIVEPVLGLRLLKPVVYSALEDGSVASALPIEPGAPVPAVEPVKKESASKAALAPEEE